MRDAITAYSLTQCTFLLQFGKLYSLFSPKWTFLASLFVFEIGSLISAVAPTSLALIIGVRVSCCRSSKDNLKGSSVASYRRRRRGRFIRRRFCYYHAHVALGETTNLAKFD